MIPILNIVRFPVASWYANRVFWRKIVPSLKGFVNVYYDKDADGFLSAILFSMMLENLGIEHRLIPFERFETEISDGINVFLDTRPVEKRGKIIVIDHHRTERREIADVYLNFFKIFGMALSNAFYLSILYGRNWNINPVTYWISSYADGAIKRATPFIRLFLAKGPRYNLIIKKVAETAYYINFFPEDENTLGKLIVMFKDIFRKGLEAIPKYKDLILKALEGINKAVFNSLELIKDIWEGEDVVVAFLRESRGREYRIINQYLRLIYPEKELYVSTFKKEEGIYRISMRSSRIDIPKLLEKISKKVEILEYGGHRGAGGCYVKENYLENFLKEIMKS